MIPLKLIPQLYLLECGPMKSALAIHYREQIKQAYQDRCLRNPAYSLRAFARDLGIAYSRLHDVINGKKGLSSESAEKVASKLNLNSSEKEIFLTKVEAEHSRSPIVRKKALQKLDNLKTLYGNQTIEENIFRLIKDWHHFALVELTTVEGFNDSPQWISERLGISLAEVEGALKRLMELKVLERKEGKLIPSEQFTFTDSAIPSDAIRRSHEQILNKAKQALYFQTIDERDFNSFTFAVDTSDIEHAKKFIKDFLVEFDRQFAKGNKKKAVYSLSTQLIRLDSEGSHAK